MVNMVLREYFKCKTVEVNRVCIKNLIICTLHQICRPFNLALQHNWVCINTVDGEREEVRTKLQSGNVGS